MNCPSSISVDRIPTRTILSLRLPSEVSFFISELCVSVERWAECNYQVLSKALVV
jgi:hypothetical protein